MRTHPVHTPYTARAVFARFCVVNGAYGRAALTNGAYVVSASSFAWVPSQITGSAECLQAQKNTSLVSVAVHFTGAKSVPLCEPSQNGWFADRPQEHQKYDLSASTRVRIGERWAILGSFMAGFRLVTCRLVACGDGVGISHGCGMKAVLKAIRGGLTPKRAKPRPGFWYM